MRVRGALLLPKVTLNPSLSDTCPPLKMCERTERAVAGEPHALNPILCRGREGACPSGFFSYDSPSCSWPAGEFPTLQNKMRAILRIEVEAVRFLKEEPHRLDSLLQRVRGMTDVLTVLRR